MLYGKEVKMNTTIRFPNLGLTFNPGKTINILGLDIAYYGLIIGCGMLIGAWIVLREAKRTNQNADDYIDIILYVLISALVGARLYYVIFEWDYYKNNLLEIFNMRRGGLAIYGGIIAGAAVVIIFSNLKKTFARTIINVVYQIITAFLRLI